MKKLFSAFLILCMVFTSLSVGVSASYTKESNGDNTFLLDSAYSQSTDNVYNTGDWYMSNGTVKVKLGTISEHTDNMGLKFKKIELTKDSITNVTPGSKLSIRTEITKTSNYGTSYSQGDCGTEYFSIGSLDNIVGAIDTDGDDNIDANSGKVVKYTAYAYTKNANGEPISFNIVRQANVFGTSFVVPASKLYSADNIPHKIDLIYYHPGDAQYPVGNNGVKTNNKVIQHIEIWIDGLFYDSYEGNLSINDSTANFVFLSANVNLASDSNGVVSWNDSEMYICATPDGTKGSRSEVSSGSGKYVKFFTRDTLHNELFQTATYTANPTVTARTNIATGVKSELVEDIEALYTTALETGDRVLEVDESIYNAPESIWTGNDSSVTLVNKNNGTVLNAGDSVTGTFEDYYIAINGVYTKVVEKAVENSYDKDTKTAVVNVSTLPVGTDSLQIIVAAYNADKLAGVKASKVYTGAELESNITYTISGAFPTDASKYKVFYFKTLGDLKPLMEALVR